MIHTLAFVQDDSATVHSDNLRDGSDSGVFVQDPIEEACDNGPGSDQARTWACGGEDGGGNGVCGVVDQPLRCDDDQEEWDDWNRCGRDS